MWVNHLGWDSHTFRELWYFNIPFTRLFILKEPMVPVTRGSVALWTLRIHGPGVIPIQLSGVRIPLPGLLTMSRFKCINTKQLLIRAPGHIIRRYNSSWTRPTVVPGANSRGWMISCFLKSYIDYVRVYKRPGEAGPFNLSVSENTEITPVFLKIHSQGEFFTHLSRVYPNPVQDKNTGCSETREAG